MLCLRYCLVTCLLHIENDVTSLHHLQKTAMFTSKRIPDTCCFLGNFYLYLALKNTTEYLWSVQTENINMFNKSIKYVSLANNNLYYYTGRAPNASDTAATNSINVW